MNNVKEFENDKETYLKYIEILFKNANSNDLLKKDIKIYDNFNEIWASNEKGECIYDIITDLKDTLFNKDCEVL